MMTERELRSEWIKLRAMWTWIFGFGGIVGLAIGSVIGGHWNTKLAKEFDAYEQSVNRTLSTQRMRGRGEWEETLSPIDSLKLGSALMLSAIASLEGDLVAYDVPIGSIDTEEDWRAYRDGVSQSPIADEPEEKVHSKSEIEIQN